MIEITELASEKLTAYLSENNNDSSIRITAMNGCGGSTLGLAIDECKDSDHVQENDSFILLIDQELSQAYGKVTVDFIEKSSGCGCEGGGGFSLTSERPLPGAGGGCGSSCSSGCGG